MLFNIFFGNKTNVVVVVVGQPRRGAICDFSVYTYEYINMANLCTYRVNSSTFFLNPFGMPIVS